MSYIPDISNLRSVILAVLILFTVIIGRYVLIAGFFYIIFYLQNPTKWNKRKVYDRVVKADQLKKEIGWSAITSLIFAIAGVFTLWCWQHGYTKIYTGISPYGWWYLPVSLALLVFIHETYYYWLHRLMHHRFVFRFVHKIHHDSNTTSPFTAFSFHPLEGLLQAIIIPLTLMVLPVNVYIILLQLTVMTFSSVINHLNIEIYPKNFHKHRLGKWIIGATHHSLHHKQFKYNFGLYFTFWDKIKSTESPDFNKMFERKTIL